MAQHCGPPRSPTAPGRPGGPTVLGHASLQPALARAASEHVRPKSLTKLPVHKEPCRWRSCVWPLPAGTPDGDKHLHVNLGKGPELV